MSAMMHNPVLMIVLLIALAAVVASLYVAVRLVGRHETEERVPPQAVPGDTSGGTDPPTR